MRCCAGSSWREWYLLPLPRCASISRQLLLRLPVKPPPPPSSSLGIRTALLPGPARAPQRPQPQVHQRLHARGIRGRERRHLFLLGLEYRLIGVGLECRRCRLSPTSLLQLRAGDAPNARRPAQLDHRVELEQELLGQHEEFILEPLFVKESHQRVLSILEGMLQAGD